MQSFEQPRIATEQKPENEIKKEKAITDFVRKQTKKITTALAPIMVAGFLVFAGCEKETLEIKPIRPEGITETPGAAKKQEKTKGEYVQELVRLPDGTVKEAKVWISRKMQNLTSEERSELTKTLDQEKERLRQPIEEKLRQEREQQQQQQQQEKIRRQEWNKKVQEETLKNLPLAKEIIDFHEYEKEEIHKMIEQAKAVYEFFGESIPGGIKEFINQSDELSEDKLVKFAEQIDEKTATRLAVEMVYQFHTDYQRWEDCDTPGAEEKIKNIIQYGLPQKWSNYAIQRIKFNRKMFYLGMAPKYEGEFASSIILRGGGNLFSNFYHEYAHATDPFVNPLMRLDRRIKTLFLLKTYFNEHFKIITIPPNIDTKEVRTSEAKEMLAYAMQIYLEDSDDPSLKMWKRKLCEDYLHLATPDFNIKEAESIKIKK